MKKILVFCLCLVLFLSFVSAGFFGDLFTGKAIREATPTEDTKIIGTTSDSITLKEGTKVELEGYEVYQPYVTEESVRIVVKDQKGESKRIIVKLGESAILSGGETIIVTNPRRGDFFRKDEVDITIIETPEKEPQPIEPFKEEVVPRIIGFGEKSKEVKELTEKLFELNNEYDETSSLLFFKKGKILGKLEEIAKEREKEMIKLAEENPILFLNKVMSKKERDLLPDKIKLLVEKRTEIEGTLLTLHIDDFTNQISSFEHFIITKDNKRIDFYPVRRDLGFLPMIEVKVSGYQIDETFVGFLEIEKTLLEPISEKLTPTKLPFKPIPPVIDCIDSDGGINYYTKGTITVDGRTEVDSCNTDGTLREWFCGTPGDPAGLLRSENFVSCLEGSSCIEGVCSKEHKMVVLLVDFLDSQTQPFTPTEAYDLIFNGQFQNFYQENSYGRIHFRGDVFGWFTLSRNSQDFPGCRPSIGGWSGNELDPFIINNNIDLSNYDGLVIVSNGFGCGGGIAGPNYILEIDEKEYDLFLAYVLGGVPINQPNNLAWNLLSDYSSGISNNYPPSFSLTNLDFILVHEIGHTFGVMHANGWDCDDATLGFDCAHREYGNLFDAMGVGQYALNFNALYKEMFELILPPEVLTITQSGTYIINDLETLGGKKFAKIQVLGSNLFPYYLEYRKGIGFDRSLNYPDLISNQEGLLINKLYYSTYSGDPAPKQYQPRILDMNPTSTNWWDDSKESSLSGSNIFYDTRAGITIGPIINYDSDSITFEVNLQQTSCIRELPSIVNYDQFSFPIGPDQIFGLFFVFKNYDFLICNSSDFNVTLDNLPPGFSLWENFEPNIENLYPDEEFAIYAWLKTSPTICTGSYPISFTIENLNSGLTTTETVIVNIDGELCPQVLPPVF